MASDLTSGRSNQKQRTRAAILEAARDTVRTGETPTMPAVAKKALVSEATAYRYFPDLAALLREAFVAVLPTVEELMAPVSDEPDAAVRVAFAATAMMREIRDHEGAIRVMISSTVARPAGAAQRPGRRFGLIDIALQPVAKTLKPRGLQQLRRDLAVVIGAEAYLILVDLVGLSSDEAIVSAVRTATTLTRAAVG